ncbi:MAG: calcium-binding protein, partial [Gemmatimonadales bacterium]|nr:calcium-binding protein [Gemmatimonadales bacterium]
ENILIGGAGDDVLTGGLKADTLDGGAGTDTLAEQRDADFTLTDAALTIGLEG